MTRKPGEEARKETHMANQKTERSMPTSAELAAGKSLIPVWDPDVPFPSSLEMREPDAVKHVFIPCAQPGDYQFLHSASITYHRGLFYLALANHRTGDNGNRDELIRGCTSADGLIWSEPSVWLQPPRSGADSINYPLLFSHDGQLHGFFVGWHEGRPTAELFILEDNGKWQYYREACIPRFLPFCPPQPMDDGNWIMGGEYFWNDASVAISLGDDFRQWKRVEIPRSGETALYCPETALINQRGRLLAFCRPNGTATAPVSESRDCGHTWTPAALSNFPLSPGQPFAGKLSTGQNYLLTNSLEEGAALLTIAVTGPGGGLFRRVFKVCSSSGGNAVCKPAEWSRPSAVEHDGKLYISCVVSKKDCALSIVPVSSLAL